MATQVQVEVQEDTTSAQGAPACHDKMTDF
jgi:hypothetical protein